MIDIHHIQARHDQINIRLEHWAKWVRVKPRPWSLQPMFRMYQSKARQWDASPHIPVSINAIDALEIERAVSFLPEHNRTVTRWYYVFPWVPPGKIQRVTGLTLDALAKMLDDSRDMVKNRIREKLVDTT